MESFLSQIFHYYSSFIIVYLKIEREREFMNKNIKLLYCILGTIILTLASTPIPYNALHYIPIIGFWLSQLTYFISAMGVILSLYFAILLIKENWQFKSK